MGEPNLTEEPTTGHILKFPITPAAKARRKMTKKSGLLDSYFEELGKVAGPLQENDREDLFRLLYRFKIRNARERMAKIGLDPDDPSVGLNSNKLEQIEANCRTFVDNL